MIEATSSDTVAVISGIKRKANEVDAEEAESTPDQPPQKLSFSASSNLNRFGFESSQSSSTPVLILNPGHQPAVRIRDIERDRPQLGSRQRKNEFEPYSNGDMTNISQFIDTNIEYPKHRSETKSLDEAASSSDISSLCHASPYHSVIVSLPSWFSLNEIHDIEKMALAEYFTEEQQDKQHSPEQYKKCRNYMIEHYRKNPSYYLSIIACKAELEADLVDIVRIHSFLELHGLINTQVDPRRRIFDPYIDSDCDAAVKPKSQRDFQDRSAADMQRLRDLIFDASIPRDARSAWSLEIDDPLNPDQRKVFKCSHCHVDCSAVRYQNLKHKGFQVCIDCYLQGRFPATMASGDFLRVDSTADTLEEEDWSREEVLRLLEGIDMYDEDWLMISEHVGSRSKEQCVTKFLQLPMDDEFLTAQLNEQEMEQLPFSDVSNPVMTLIAFLSGHINPGVGSAAAKSALKEFLKHGKKLESTDTNEEEGEEINVDADDKMSETSDNNDINDANGTKAATPQSAFDASVMKQASLAALKGAVDQAEKLASYEDQEIQHWTRLAVKTLVDKLTLKVQQYDELDTVLGPELKELEKQSAVLAASFESLVRHRLSNVSSTSSTAAAAAAVAAATPVTSATPSTPVTAENSSAPPTSSSQTS
ncbi:uncharacterized protein BYT42DRAFT_639308 [Radiomyces spectabilis]|uniref:uncharacterized protein n=1 Tax=Radiomyces spectabilis TaxID=64574 RepID=UPI00221F090D|nr:uncharacterized protein BYT42DRAFT_639308 [Radiomyces spectabilis]KAI8374259.1 hypothetical protein BYT42DRAFT_639308 [Radiomyces spectabilis]